MHLTDQVSKHNVLFSVAGNRCKLSVGLF